MLGRVRACSLSSLRVLETERTPSKLLKDDSLSIYETTLMKLKQGSQHDFSLTPEESMASVSSDEALTTVTAPDCSSIGSFPSLGKGESVIISNEKPCGNLSILYLFSRYRSSQNNNLGSLDESAMAKEDNCKSAKLSPSYSPDCHILNKTRPDHTQGCVVDQFPVI